MLVTLRLSCIRTSDTTFDDRGYQFPAAANGGSEGAVRPSAWIFLPGATDQRVPLLPMALG